MLFLESAFIDTVESISELNISWLCYMQKNTKVWNSGQGKVFDEKNRGKNSHKTTP